MSLFPIRHDKANSADPKLSLSDKPKHRNRYLTLCSLFSASKTYNRTGKTQKNTVGPYLLHRKVTNQYYNADFHMKCVESGHIQKTICPKPPSKELHHDAQSAFLFLLMMMGAVSMFFHSSSVLYL